MAGTVRRRFAIYGACAAVLSAVLGFEVGAVTAQGGGAGAARARAVDSSGGTDARPLPASSHLPGESHVDPELSRIATTLGRGRAEVRCWSPSDWAPLLRELDEGTDVSAYASIDDRRVHLPAETCAWLRVSWMPSLPRSDRAAALESFAHELEHLRGVDDEARAECYAYQNLAAVARALRASAHEARHLARAAWRELYPPSDPAYVSPECRNGGRLDLHPRRSEWP